MQWNAMYGIEGNAFQCNKNAKITGMPGSDPVITEVHAQGETDTGTPSEQGGGEEAKRVIWVHAWVHG